MENKVVTHDLLNIKADITATPAVNFVKQLSDKIPVPLLSASDSIGGFSVTIEAALQYDALTKIINGYLVNKRFEISEGFIEKHVIIKECQMYSGDSDNLIISVDFTGSFNGTVYFTGKPFYNSSIKRMELREFDYDLNTKDFLLKAAKWLFDKKIIAEIKKHTAIDLSAHHAAATKALNEGLNKEWAKGIRGSGTITDLTITAIQIQQQHLLIRTACTGNISVTVNEIDLKL